MRFRRFGSGFPVVKLAGLVGGVDLYGEEIRVVADAGFEVGALDTTGDRADDPARATLSWDDLAAEALEAADRLSSGPVLFWGTSFGSLLALAVAARRPERVAGMLLSVAPDPEWTPPLYLGALRFAERRRRPVYWKAGAFQLGFLGLVAWEFLRPGTLRRLPRVLRASFDARTPPRTIADKLDLLWGVPPGWPPDGIPATLVAGRWDTVVPRSCARRLAGRLDARIRWVPRAGHSLALSRARVYQTICVEELRRLAGPVGSPGLAGADCAVPDDGPDRVQEGDGEPVAGPRG